MTERLRLCVPSKGALHDGCLKLLEDCLIPVHRSGSARSYSARLGGMDDVEVLLARADEIPELLSTRQADLGITGLDLVRESDGDGGQQSTRVVIEDLGFGRARLVVAVPRAWLDVSHWEDLVEVATEIRSQHGRALRVASKFPTLVRRHFQHGGLVDYRLVQSLGATEGAPRAGTSDVIVDLTSSGATLESNGLKQIRGGTVLESQACLVAGSDPAVWSQKGLRDSLRYLVSLLAGAIEARAYRGVSATFRQSLTEAERSSIDRQLDGARWTESAQGLRLDARIPTEDLHAVLKGAYLRAESILVSDAALLVKPTQYTDAFFAALQHSRR